MKKKTDLSAKICLVCEKPFSWRKKWEKVWNEVKYCSKRCSSNKNKNDMITVFYDGKCGLCSKEINHYRKIAPNGIFDWQDITESADELHKEGITLSEGLKLLHAKDNSGKVHVGVDAFLLIWKQLKRWRVLAAWVGMPIIHQIAGMGYRTFANWRFKRLEHCQLAAKQEE